MVAPVRIDDGQRRARLVARHHLDRSATDVVSVTRDVVAMHSSDPLTPYLASWARLPAFTTDDLASALYEDRVLWRLHAMRRTLFLVTVDDAPAVLAAASSDVARAERRRLEGYLAAEVGDGRASRWLAEVEEATLAAIGDDEVATRSLSAAVPALSTEITVGSGRWANRSPVASRVLLLLAMEGRLVRARPLGTWRSSQYRWVRTDRWFGASPTPPDDGEARATLVRRYLERYGPATLEDVRWWTGWGKGRTREALAAVAAQEVVLDGGVTGYVLPGDAEDGPERPPDVVSFLPSLDPTIMGWKERAFLLTADGAGLFDRAGNAGPTVWVAGRAVGGWAQAPDGTVRYGLLEDVGRACRERLDAEAAALTEWLDGVVVAARFPSPFGRSLAG